MDDPAPWFEPPAWWKEGMIDGLTWEELLNRTWAEVQRQPPSPEERRMRAWARTLGKVAASTSQALILSILMNTETIEGPG
jgi:hypothetical protein